MSSFPGVANGLMATVAADREAHLRLVALINVVGDLKLIGVIPGLANDIVSKNLTFVLVPNMRHAG